MSPLLTVEFKTKWYELFLIQHVVDSTDSVNLSSIHFGFLDDICPGDTTPFVDHVPNPHVVRLFARRYGYEIDELALDLIYGRWQNEVVEDMWMECERCDGSGEVTDAYDPDGLLPPWCKPRLETCRACKGHGYLKPEGKKQ